MDKLHNNLGKARQVKTCNECGQHIDESQRYKDWVRGVNTGDNGVWIDLDLIKVRSRTSGEYVVAAITDLTYAQTHNLPYLNAITTRWFERDHQGKIFQGVSAQLGVPAFLVAYGQNMISVLDINDPDAGWHTMTLDIWAERVNEL